jgi:hypothetical protein
MLVAVLRIPGQNDEPREELRVVEQKKQESFRQDIAGTKTNPRARRIFLSSNRPLCGCTIAKWYQKQVRFLWA